MDKQLYRNPKTGVIATIDHETDESIVLVGQNDDLEYAVAKAKFNKQWKPITEAQAAACATGEEPKESKPEKPVVPTATEEEQAENIETAKIKVANLFDRVNAAFFGGRLPELAGIEIGLAPLPFKQYDYNADHNVMIVGGQHLNASLSEVATLVFHMAIHYNCAINSISCTCQNGRYHNRVFQKMAEAAGFEVGMNRSIGYGILTPGADFAEKIGYTDEELAESFMAEQFKVVKNAKAPASREAKPPFRQYKCPGCGVIAKAREGSSLMCGDCMTALEVVE